jgi:hypothetical protein
MNEKLLQEQNKILKNLLKIMVELLPRHSSNCYGRQVHPSNKEEYCDCNMSEIRKQIKDIK